MGDTVPGNGIQLYHAADCLLRGSNSGLGSLAQSTPACTINANNSPASASETFAPITTGTNAIESTDSTVWSDVDTDSEVLPNTCDCATSVNNGAAIEWFVPSPAMGESSATFQFDTTIVDAVPTGAFSLNGTPGTPLNATVATIADPNTTATASAYSATINWGDGNSSAGTVAGGNGNFTVTGNHAYAVTGAYPIAVTITSAANNLGSSTVNDSAAITAAPTPVTTSQPPSLSATGAGFSGSADPNGLATTAFFQYGLDPKYTGGGPVVYTSSTPAQAIGSDFTSRTVSASVSGLVPHAVYHVRLVAANSAGTTFGPDVTFTTSSLPAPGSPTLGKTFNISPVSGVVLVKIHGVFVPLTELSQLPKNTVIDALHGTLSLTTAAGAGGPAPAHDAAAKGKKHKPKVKTQKGTFGGAVFKISQATRGPGKGLVTLTLVEGAAVKGAPTYATCKKHNAADVNATIASSKTLQLLHASARGRFTTRGRYSAATVRGTKWTVADRCDGTLTRDITDSVSVTDFVRHKTIILHAGQSYLARALK